MDKKELFIISKNDIEEIVSKITSKVVYAIKEESKANNEDEILSVSETCNKYGVSKSTLWRWEKSKYLIPVRMGSKCFYKKTDIIKALS